MLKILLRLLIVVVVGFVIFVAGGYAFMSCVIWKSEQRFQNDAALLAPFLNADPAYKKLTPMNFPSLGYCLGGPVENKSDYDRLREEVVRNFAEDRVQHIMTEVWIESTSKAKPGLIGQSK